LILRLQSIANDGFGAIGGPPFVRLEGLHRSQKERLRYYRQRFLSAQRSRFDLYMLFIEQALDLLKPGGLLAFSLSNSFVRSEGGRRIRGYIAANASVEEVVEFDDPRTYADAATQIALLRLRKTRATCGSRHVVGSQVARHPDGKRSIRSMRHN
jgi:methylase of polypeptide subunit release factors